MEQIRVAPTCRGLAVLTQTYYVSRQHRRAVMLLKNHGVMDDVRFRYLAAKCLAEVQQWDECLTLLGDGEFDDDMQEVSLLSRWAVPGTWLGLSCRL